MPKLSYDITGIFVIIVLFADKGGWSVKSKDSFKLVKPYIFKHTRLQKKI